MTNKLSQGQTLDHRYIVCGEDMNKFIITYRRLMYVFRDVISKHNKYILNILQQLNQSQRLKNIFTVLEGVFRNMNEWMCNNLHTDIIKFITDSQVHTANDTRRATNELMNHRVKTDNIQYCNTYQELILLDIVTESDILKPIQRSQSLTSTNLKQI